jgi:hypothetical protein
LRVSFLTIKNQFFIQTFDMIEWNFISNFRW